MLANALGPCARGKKKHSDRFLEIASEITAMAQESSTETPTIVPTGIEGLDDILRGGLVANRLYLIEGNPGSGKTTLALQFLLQGVRQGERCMLVSLSE